MKDKKMLFLITNRHMIKRPTLSHVIEEAIDGGVNGIILREKDLAYEELIVIAKEIKEKIKDKDVLFIINRNLKIGKEINLDGYHIGFHDLVGKKPIWNNLLGVSVHSLEEAIMAEKKGASYILASHVYETDCKKGLKGRGIDFIKEIKENTNIPLIALGGINHENVKEVMSTGVEGVAVMSYIMAAEDPYMSAKKIKDHM
ncbi:MAG: thiamine phosphate synthase [Anaeromicrobium sp.]|uniref:thiamine phosphate synthase n=1 Tax=Anaeromicrobium sp. TaxID=1929132 RepID=UPI0025DC6A37|nr:thiamine phosphate synthase [Anaeromicrobium sp.]MCT4595683.1 thiamine phosphate synthase [Anaeromicrobium sp.]